MPLATELVIFDMDGLLFDTETLTLNCWLEVCDALGYPRRPEVFRALVGRDIVDAQRIIGEEMGAAFPFQQGREMRDTLVIRYVEEHGTPLKPGLFELLDYLDRRGVRRVVATSTEEYRASRLLQCAGVDTRIDGVVYGNEVAHGKPFPDIFQRAAGGVPPQRCLVVEDSPAGVEAAYRAGMPVILISDLIEPDETVLARCTVRLQSLRDVIAYLEAEPADSPQRT